MTSSLLEDNRGQAGVGHIPVPWWYAVMSMIAMIIAMSVGGTPSHPFAPTPEAFAVIVVFGLGAGPIAVWNLWRADDE